MGVIKVKTKVRAPYELVKKLFLDREGKLFRFLVPPFVEIVHYKGVRRGAIIKIKVLSRPCEFKVITYSTDKTKLSFNDIITKGDIFGATFWSHRHFVEKTGTHTMITDELAFTSRNKIRDAFLHIFLFCSFKLRSLKYKVFVFFNR